MQVNRQTVTTHTWSLRTIISLLVLILGLSFTISPIASAEENVVTPPEEPPKLVLSSEPAQPTSPEVMKAAGAMLTWTPTGSGETQDTYSIRIAESSETDEKTNELKTPLLQADNLTAAQYDVSTLADGVYYWQVRSCGLVGLCKDWTYVWTVTIDSVAPGVPSGEVTSGAYDKMVVFAGEAEPGTRVSITVEGDASCTTTADAQSVWECRFTSEFKYGSYAAEIVSADAADNISEILTVNFSVSELFVAPQITTNELPQTLEVVPIVPPVSITKTNDVPVPIATESTFIPIDRPVAQPKSAESLSTDGGVVQSSENGWQIFGLPWFVWLVGGAGIGTAWSMLGLPKPRLFSSTQLSSN